ncbi:DUF2812 domain-containing protein [Alkalihalobacillus sp. FSL W8-0930]
MNEKVKKISKTFSNFKEEEKWLKEMSDAGWMLIKYGTEVVSDNTYVFKRNLKTKYIIFKVDYREFNAVSEYEEYKEISEDSGWILVSKNKSYSKHIFYTESINLSKVIFSDSQSFKGRESRKMHSSLMTFFSTLIVFLICILLYSIYGWAGFGGVGLLTLFGSFKYLMDYIKHRKVYKSII